MANALRWDNFNDFLYAAISGSVIYAILRRLEATNNRLEHLVASRTVALAASEAESRPREKWMNALVARLPDVSWTTAQDLSTIFVSANVESMFGVSTEEVYRDTAKILLERVHPEDYQRFIDGFHALFTLGQPFDEEFRVQRTDGRWIWVRDRAIRTHREDGVVYADGVLSDITARKEAEEARKESDKRYRLLFERNLTGMFRAELGGKLLDCNPAFFRML